MQVRDEEVYFYECKQWQQMRRRLETSREFRSFVLFERVESCYYDFDIGKNFLQRRFPTQTLKHRGLKRFGMTSLRIRVQFPLSNKDVGEAGGVLSTTEGSKAPSTTQDQRKERPNLTGHGFVSVRILRKSITLCLHKYHDLFIIFYYRKLWCRGSSCIQMFVKQSKSEW